MLSFYHIRVAGALRGSEQRREGAQRLEIDLGGVGQRPRPAGLGVAHPARDLHPGEARPLRGCAPHDPETGPASLRPDLDLVSLPRVPPVASFQHVGIVGVRSLGCITGGGRTCRWAWIAPSPDPCYHPIRASLSPSRKSADCNTITNGWRHEVRGWELDRRSMNIREAQPPDPSPGRSGPRVPGPVAQTR
jgi:hypothetical protein